MLGMAFAMVEYFYSSQNPVHFAVTSKFHNSTHILIDLGTGHNLEIVYLSYMYIHVWELNYFKYVDGFAFNLTNENSTFKWDNNPSLLTVIGLTSFSGSYPINFTSVLTNCTLIPQTNQNQTLKFGRIQPVLQICSYGSK
jgi:hypothetical protein